MAQVFAEGFSDFDDPNLKVLWRVVTYWDGDKLVTSEHTPDGKYNGGKPIVCSRWVDENDCFVSHFVSDRRVTAVRPPCNRRATAVQPLCKPLLGRSQLTAPHDVVAWPWSDGPIHAPAGVWRAQAVRCVLRTSARQEA